MSAPSETARLSVRSTRERSTRNWLVVTAILLWIEAWIGTVVAVQKKLPYGFGGHGHANDVWGDVVSGGGTALSPPLVVMIIFAVLIVFATRRGWVGTAGVVGLTLLAVLSLVTIIGEPLARRVLTSSDVAFPETALIIVSLIGAILMFLFGVWNLVALYGERSALSPNTPDE